MRIRHGYIVTVQLMLLALTLLAGESRAAENSMVMVDGRGLFSLYQGTQLSDLLSIESAAGYDGSTSLVPDGSALSPTMVTSNLDDLAGKGVALWFFNDEQAVNAVSQGERETIADLVKSGASLGIGGDDEFLKEKFALSGSRGNMEPSGDGYYAFLTSPTSQGLHRDYQLKVQSDLPLGRAWGYLMDWSNEQLSSDEPYRSSKAGHIPLEAEVAPRLSNSDSSYDPWNAVYNYKSADGGDAGDVSVTVSVFQLDSTSQEYDWFRVDSNVQGSTYDYYDWWVSIGNYLYSIYSVVENTGMADKPEWGELWEHAPETTQTNSSISYSLGADLGGEVAKDPKGEGKVSVGYSKSYDCNEVTIYDKSSHYKNLGEWDAQPMGPDWNSWLFGSYAASATAQTSYTYEPSTIWRVPKGETLTLRARGYTYLAYETFYLLVVDHQTWKEASVSDYFEVKAK